MNVTDKPQNVNVLTDMPDANVAYENETFQKSGLREVRIFFNS